MSKSLAVAVICGLVAFSTGCGDDEDPSSGGMAGTTGGDSGDESDSGEASDAETDAGDGADSGGQGGTGGANDGKSWTHLGYDQSNTYHNPFETKITVDNAPTLENKWTFPTAAVPHGGLSIAEGKVFASTTGGTYAINLADGVEVWFNPDVKAESTPAYHDGAVYVHSIGAILHKLDAATGDEIWASEKTYDIPGSDGTSSAVIGGNKVIVGHSAGRTKSAASKPPRR